MERQKKEIGALAAITLGVLLFSNSPVFASEFGEAIVGYLKSPETYNPSSPQAKVTERTNFCSCVMSSGPALFDGCTPIHPVLPNLPPSFIRNRLLNEFLVSSTSNTKTAAQIATDLQSKLTTCPTYANTFTSQFTVTNSSYSIGDPSSYVGGGGIGMTAGVSNFCEGMAPNDPFFNEQWGLCETEDETGHPSNIKAANAWDATEGDDEIVVAVIDTGVDYTHEDLSANIWVNDDPIGDIADTCDRVAAPSIALADDDCNGKIDDARGWNFAENNADPMDTNGHGTEMAGVIASVMYNNMGVAGVCPNCKIMPLRVDPATFPAAQVAAAVGYAIEEGADVINMSFFKRYSTGTPNFYGEASPQLRSAYEDGIVLVAAAGNYEIPGGSLNAIRTLTYPAAYGYPTSANLTFDVIAVAGTDNNNERAVGYECWRGGTHYDNCTTIFGPWVDISAPGFNILSTVTHLNSALYNNADFPHYYKASGSSHASAHVAGVAALIKSMNPDVNQDLTSILGNCYFPENIVTTNRCGPNLDQRCFHDYVRELMKVTASCFAAKPYAAAEFSDFGAGLVNANEAVESVEVVPGENLAPVWEIPDPNDPVIEGEVGLGVGGFGFGLLARDPEGQPVTITPGVIPPNSEVGSWSCNGDEECIQGCGGSDCYYFDWAPAVLGTTQASFLASDGINPPVNLNVVMDLNDFNYAPVFGPMPDIINHTIIARGGQPFTFSFAASDSNNDDFGVCIEDFMIFDAIGAVNGTSTLCSQFLGENGWIDYPRNGPGPFNFNWQVPSGLTGDREFLLRFDAVDERLSEFNSSATASGVFHFYVNDSPVFVNPPTTVNGTVGVPLSFTFSTSNTMDPNNDQHWISMTNTVPGGSFNSETRTFSMTPSSGGTYTANFRAWDRCETTDYTTGFITWAPCPYSNYHDVTINVSGSDTAGPVVSSMSPPVQNPIYRTTNRYKTFNAQVSDSSGLSQSVLRLDGAVQQTVSLSGFGPASVSYTPTSALSYGDHTYSITVTDVNNNATTISVTFNVYSSGGGGGGGGGSGSGTKDSNGLQLAATQNMEDWMV